MSFKILSFDCANKTMGYCIMMVNAAAINDPQIYINNLKNGAADNYLFKLIAAGVIDICGGKLMKNTTSSARRRCLIERMKFIFENWDFDLILLEDQPFGKNKYSWAVQEQIATICTLWNIPFKTIKPKMKLRLRFGSAAGITIGNYIEKWGKGRPTNKKFARDLMRWAMSIDLFHCGGMKKLNGISAAFHSDIADSILQVIAFLLLNNYKYI